MISQKSNKPTKTKSKMKTMKNFLSMAALALVGAVMTGCSSDDNIQQPANNDNAYILKTTISFDTDDVTNRALSVDFLNKKATKTFAVGDQIAVFFVDGKGRSMRALSNALTIDDIHNDGKSADFTVDFVGSSGTTPGDNAQVRYVYPANMAKGSIDTGATINDANTIDYSNLAYQTGDLDYLGDAYDLAVFDGNLSGTNLPALATLTNRLAILALTLKNSDGSSIITNGLVSVEVEGSETYSVAPKGGGTFGEDVIYVAIKPEEKALKITASDGTNDYEKTLTSRTYAAGNFYNMPVRMDAAAPAATGHALSAAVVGDVVGSDGQAYDGTDYNNLPTGVTAVGVIAYVGEQTEVAGKTNGLAIALADESSQMDWSTALSTCSGKTPTVTGASAWMLPSQTQWQKMFEANGGLADHWTGLNAAITTAGGTGLQMDSDYWTSTEYVGSDARKAHIYYSSNTGMVNTGSIGPKSDTHLVRACFAF